MAVTVLGSVTVLGFLHPVLTNMDTSESCSNGLAQALQLLPLCSTFLRTRWKRLGYAQAMTTMLGLWTKRHWLRLVDVGQMGACQTTLNITLWLLQVHTAVRIEIQQRRSPEFHTPGLWAAHNSWPWLHIGPEICNTSFISFKVSITWDLLFVSVI